MNSPEFVEAVAHAIRDSHEIVLADDTDEHPAVWMVWGVSTQPDTILARTHEGDVFQVKVRRLPVALSNRGHHE